MRHFHVIKTKLYIYLFETLTPCDYVTEDVQVSGFNCHRQMRKAQRWTRHPHMWGRSELGWRRGSAAIQPQVSGEAGPTQGASTSGSWMQTSLCHSHRDQPLAHVEQQISSGKIYLLYSLAANLNFAVLWFCLYCIRKWVLVSYRNTVTINVLYLV